MTPSLPFSSAHRQRISSAFKVVLLLTVGTGFGSSTHAADLVIRVSGVTEPLGEIGCSLFSEATGFPMDNKRARQLWVPAEPGGVTCRFDQVSEGTYVVSIGHDVNGNRKVDTNLVGMPTEQWGVSKNVRPVLRAPKFEEAKFTVSADAGQIVLDIKVAK